MSLKPQSSSMTITSSDCVAGPVTPAPEFLSALFCAFRLRDFFTTLSSSESNKSSTSLPEGAEGPLDALFRFVFFAFGPVLSASSSESIIIASLEVVAIGGEGAAAVDGELLGLEPELPTGRASALFLPFDDLVVLGGSSGMTAGAGGGGFA